MPPRRHINPPLNVYRKIAFSFIIIVAVLIGVIFYFTLSFAYINITPKSEEINTDFNFIVVEDAKAVNSEQGIFAGKVVDQTVEAEKSFTATGSKVLQGDTLGKVKIFNNLDRNQVLVATTRLLTADNILFRLKSRVDVPARGSVETLAYPDDTTKPLAKAGDKFTIPGLSTALQQSVYAQAIEDFQVAGQTVTVVSKEDLDKALASYTDELALQAISDVTLNQAKVLKKEVLAQEYSNKEGDQVSNFKLKLKIRVTGAIFDQVSVVNYAEKVISGIMPTDKELVADNKDTLIFDLEKVDLTNHLAQLKSNIKGVIVISPNSQIFDRQKLKSMNYDQLKAYFANFSEIQSFDIKYFPSWLKKMPFFEDHIIIKVNP
jgi:hypothetical protein